MINLTPAELVSLFSARPVLRIAKLVAACPACGVEAVELARDLVAAYRTRTEARNNGDHERAYQAGIEIAHLQNCARFAIED